MTLVDIVAKGRIGFALCRDGLLPAWIGEIHEKWETPFRVTIGTTAGPARGGPGDLQVYGRSHSELETKSPGEAAVPSA
ncbi:hypothetical protein BH10ACT10_BH10ACT10_18990 [soil metagenome]